MLDLKTKRILISGAEGLLGPALIENLTKERGVPEANIKLVGLPGSDLRKREDAEAAVKEIDVVFHLASVTGGTDFHEEHPGQIFYDNVIMAAHLMEAARQAGVQKFVAIGSAAEYPDVTPVPFKEENLWYGLPEAIHIPYSSAKRMLLVMGQGYKREYGFNAIHLLMTNMYGPDMRGPGSFVIPSLIDRIHRAIKNGENEVEVWGTGAATRDFLHVKDAAEGVVLAAEKYDDVEPINLGSGYEIAIKELVGLICSLMKYDGQIRWNTSKPDGQPRRLLDISRASEKIGYMPKMNLEVGLLQMIEWIDKLDKESKK